MEYTKTFTNLPSGSGVYIMFDKRYTIIYVGKAKNIKKRVSSYFQKDHRDEKTVKLVTNIEYIRWILTDNEVEAFILENNLIKLHRPKYNILLKDEKGYPYVGITKETYARVVILRKLTQINQKRYKVFGPFLGQISVLVDELVNSYQIRNCNLSMEKNHLRPCMRFHLGKCLAPCVNKKVEAQYHENIGYIEEILKGKNSEKLRSIITEKMLIASQQQLFEKALFFRNQLSLIEKISHTQAIETLKNIESEDVWVFLDTEKSIYFCVLEVRSGKVLHKYFDLYVLDELSVDDIRAKELSIIFQYYQWRIPPRKLIFEESFVKDMKKVEEVFHIQNHYVEVICPKIESHGKQLLQRAKDNLEMEFKAYQTRSENKRMVLEFLKNQLHLKKIPHSIECFDISNIQGKDAVASMSAARSGEISPENYRKFKIKTLDTPNDFAMLREVMERRYSKLDILPDLIVIDGGKGQLSSACQVLKSLNILENVDIISLAKREEEVFVMGKQESIILSRDSFGLKLLQKLRDEAHRFGITYHRKIREKRILNSTLDGIPNVGPSTRSKLLAKFLSIENIKNANELELRKVVSERVAKNIIAYFNE